MKIDYTDKQTLPVANLAQHLLNVVAELVQDLFSVVPDHENEINYWQLIFMQSRANGCVYEAQDLPHVNWHWPHDTWFQERLRQKLCDVEFAAQRMNN